MQVNNVLGRKKYFSIYVLFLIFFVFIGFRGYVNTDWQSYKLVFDSYNNGAVIRKSPVFESGFQFLLQLVSLVSDNYITFQVVSALIDFMLFYIAFKNQKSILLCFIFYYVYCGSGSGFRLEFNLQRNIKSILIFCISLRYVQEKKFIKFLLLNVLASFLHISALLYIPFYFILNKRFNLKVLFSLFLFGNFIFLFQIEWVSNILFSIQTLIPGRLGFLLVRYVNSDVYAANFGLSIGYFERTFVFFLIYHFYKKCPEWELPYFNIMFIYLFFYLYLSEMLILLTRFSLLFVCGYWYLMPIIYYKLNKKNKLLFISIVFVYAFMKLVCGSNTMVVKYDNVLLPHMTPETRKEIIRKWTATVN